MKSLKSYDIVPIKNSFTCLHYNNNQRYQQKNNNKEKYNNINNSNKYCQTMKRIWYYMITFHNIDCNMQNYM